MEYNLIRSGRKSLAVEITREGSVLVRAPRLCARRDVERFLQSRADWIAVHLERQKQRLAARPEPDEAARAVFIQKATAEIPPRVSRYAQRMGLSPAGISITGARKRFGSCSPANRLCFSWRLMQYPEEAVDYVVVHELAHLVHRDHSARFYALVAGVLPDWKKRRAILKK